MKKIYAILTLLIFVTALIPAAAPAYAQGELVTVEIQPAGSGMKDAFIASWTGANWGNYAYLHVGEEPGASSINRSLLEFDLSGLPRDIVVESATLTLTVSSDLSNNARTMYAYALNKDWTEAGVTWNTSGSGAWAGVGASGATDTITTAIGQTAVANNLSAGTQVTMTLDNTAVEEMTMQNYFGFVLRMDVENDDLYIFDSSDGATAGNRPKLVIEYTETDTEVVDPGWICVNYSTATCISTAPMAPYVAAGPYAEVMHIFNQSKPMTSAKLQCEPYPRCQNDYPVYYRVEYDADWTSGGSTTINYSVTLAIPGGTAIGHTIACGDPGTSGNCTGVFEGIIPVTNLPPNYDGGYTVGFTQGMSIAGSLWASFGSAEWTVYMSLVPFDENCASTYMVPVPETFGIDPLLETPLGIAGVPADNQIYETVIDQIYMVRVEDGPWNDGTDDRIDASVSFDGTTWMTWEEFSVDALCIDVDPYHPEDDYRVIYFLATTETFFIRVNDLPGVSAFANNTNNISTPYQYVIGVAFVAPVPPSCEAQFDYDTVYDAVASITLPSTDDDVSANNELTEPLEASAWYGIEVASGTWHETGAVDERIDLEFMFSTDGTLGSTDWADLAEGSGLVYCISTDGLTIFVQAPAASGLTLHLRVNDQDIPNDFADNIGTLGINIYHATFTRIVTSCELAFDVGDLVYHDTVAANAGDGKAFATAFASTELDISYSYGLTPGAWYVLDTTDGPWWQTFTGGGYNSNQLYYDVEVRSGNSDWTTFEDWEFSDCVVDLDALGHQRVFFQVPADGGIEYFIKVGGANPFGRGEMGWNLYEGIDISPPGGELDGCADFIYDPDVSSGIGEIDSSLENGSHIIGLEVNTYRAIMIESANTAADEPYYQDSGWFEADGGTEDDDLQLTMDGENWMTLPNHPGVLCYYYTPESNELVYIIQVLANQTWKMRADSTSFSNNVGIELYSTYPVTAGDILDPWTSCADDYTATVPALNEHEWIPPQDEEGVNLMPTLTYTPGNDTDGDGVILWGDPGLQAGHDYMVETLEGPWEDGVNPTNYYDAQLSSDGGATWYTFDTHPDVICFVEDQIGMYWKAVFHVETGQVWKIRVADTETDAFTDNTGNLAYALNLVNEFPIDGPGDYVTDYDPGAFDVCAQALVRPESLTLSEIGSVGNYLADWMHYVNRSLQTYAAWCPRHTDLLISAITALKTREPLATVAELLTVQKRVMQDVDSYDWEGGGYEDTSIFSINTSAGVNNLISDHILPDGGEAFDIWDGGELVVFSGDQSLPAYFYTCENVFADYLPSRLKTGACFASAYWKETGASFWLQLVFDIGAIFMLFGMIKGAAQSLIYMMTGVRPWTKDGAIKVIETVAQGGDVVQPLASWRSRR